MQSHPSLSAANIAGLKWLEHKSIAFFGDSITADLKTNYVTLLSDSMADCVDLTTVNVTNSGIDSSSVFDITDRLPDALLENDADVACVFVGINDSKILRANNRPLVSVDAFKQGYSAFLDALDGARTRYKILITPPPLLFDEIAKSTLLANYWYWIPQDYDQYVNVIRDQGSRPRCVVADVFRAFANSEKTRRLFYADGVHPNLYGHRLIAKAVLDALLRVATK